MSETSGLRTADTNGFFDAACEGRLVFQRCRPAGHVQHPPRLQCATCWSDDLEEVESAGRGTIESLTVVRRAPTPAFRDRVPYVVVAVEMDEGPRMIANLLGEGAADARPGERVRVDFVADGAAVLPQFRRDEAAAGPAAPSG